MANCILYKMTSDKKEVNKSMSPIRIGRVAENPNYLPIAITEDCSIINPIIEIGTLSFNTKTNRFIELANANYCYIDIFKRYYFIEDIVIMRDNRAQLHLKVDPLYTYRDAIKGLYLTVSRQENDYNNKIADPKVLARVDRSIICKSVGAVGGSGTGYHIAITTTGGLDT